MHVGARHDAWPLPADAGQEWQPASDSAPAADPPGGPLPVPMVCHAWRMRMRTTCMHAFKKFVIDI